MSRLPLALALFAALAGGAACAQTPAPVDHAKIATFVDGAVREAMRAEQDRWRQRRDRRPRRRRDGPRLWRRRLRALPQGRRRHAVPRRLDLEDAGLDCDHAARRGRQAQSRRSDQRSSAARAAHSRRRIPQANTRSPSDDPYGRVRGTRSKACSSTTRRDCCRSTKVLRFIASTGCASPERLPSIPITARRSPARWSPISRASRGRTTRSSASCARSAWRARLIASPIPRRSRPRSAFPQPMSPETLARTTNGFSWSAGDYHTQPFEYVSNDAPAGAMSASANDMAAYMQALLDPETMAKAGVLKAETALALREPLFANTPGFAPLLHGFFDLSAQRGRSGFGHGGALVFQKSTMEIYPDEGVAIFISINTPNGGGTCSTSSPACCSISSIPRPIPRRARRGRKRRRARGSPASIARCGFRAFAAKRRRSAISCEFTVWALPSGNIVVGGERRYRPLGGGVFARGRRPGPHRLSRTGRTHANVRFVGRFPRRQNWLLCDRPLAALDRRAGGGARLVGDRGGARTLHSRRSARRKRDRRPRRLEPVVAGGGSDLPRGRQCVGGRSGGSFLFDYPGFLYPIGCWALLLAAVATPVAAGVALVWLRPREWSRWLWLRNLATLAVYGALIVTLFEWRLLGFSS